MNHLAKAVEYESLPFEAGMMLPDGSKVLEVRPEQVILLGTDGIPRPCRNGPESGWRRRVETSDSRTLAVVLNALFLLAFPMISIQNRNPALLAAVPMVAAYYAFSVLYGLVTTDTGTMLLGGTQVQGTIRPRSHTRDGQS